jgi:protein tyrosine/serine phosphatase
VSLNNFGIVKPGIYRCAQMNKKGAQDLKLLFGKLGKLVVIKLDTDEEYDSKVEASDFGPDVEIISEPVSLFNIDKDQILRIINLITRYLALGYNVIIHCMQGKDRTGLIVGALRILIDKFTWDQVEAERHEYGNWLSLDIMDFRVVEFLKSL